MGRTPYPATLGMVGYDLGSKPAIMLVIPPRRAPALDDEFEDKPCIPFGGDPTNLRLHVITTEERVYELANFYSGGVFIGYQLKSYTETPPVASGLNFSSLVISNLLADYELINYDFDNDHSTSYWTNEQQGVVESIITGSECMQTWDWNSDTSPNKIFFSIRYVGDDV